MKGPSTSRVSKCFQYALVVVGSLQMLGWVTQLDVVRNLGAMTAASPLPLVFSTFRGIEPFSSSYAIRVQKRNGEWDLYDLTPDAYSKLQGPYNYRNVYGAAFAFGARLETESERRLYSSVMKHGFLASQELRAALGIVDQAPVAMEVIQTSRARGIEGTWIVDLEGHRK